jgi:hypothetical protein
MLNLDDVKQMLTQVGENTLSLYLNVDNAAQENQATNPAWQTWLNNSFDEVEQRLAQEDRSIWREIVADVQRYLDKYTPNSKSLVLFAGRGLDGIRAYELSLPMENRIAFGAPEVGPLLWVIDEYEPYLVVLVDQEEARFFTSTLGSIGFQESVERSEDVSEWREKTIMSNPGPGVDHGAVHGGSGRDDFEKRMDEQRVHLYRDVATHIEKLMQQHSARRLILGGAEQSAHAVLNILPEKLKSSVVGVLPIPLRSTSQQIFDQALSAAEEFERQNELELVSQVIDFARSGGRGVLGREGVLQAMEMQRVELLILAWPAADTELASDLALRALSLNSGIELVHGAAAEQLNGEDGVAARLYYVL